MRRLLPLALALTLASCTGADGRAAERSPQSGVALAPPRAVLALEPFTVGDSAPPGWSAVTFGDALAARLVLGGIDVVRASGMDPSSTNRAPLRLSGLVSGRNSRLVVTAQLWRAGEREPVWTSSYWRDAGNTTQAVDAVAMDVAEAVYADAGRRAMLGKETAP